MVGRAAEKLPEGIEGGVQVPCSPPFQEPTSLVGCKNKKAFEDLEMSLRAVIQEDRMSHEFGQVVEVVETHHIGPTPPPKGWWEERLLEKKASTAGAVLEDLYGDLGYCNWKEEALRCLQKGSWLDPFFLTFEEGVTRGVLLSREYSW